MNIIREIMSIEPQEIKQIDIDLIEVGGDTQSRVGLDTATVNEYAEAMQGAAVFPAIDVYHDNAKYWLADGFHRLYAAKVANLTTIAANVREGTMREAVLHSIGANTTHGLKRSNADKHRAVGMLLKDEEWSQWSDREVARRCGVSNDFVSRLRKSICHSMTDSNDSQRTVTRNGATYLQNTGNIGRIKTYKDGGLLIDIKAIPVPDSEVDSVDVQGKSREDINHTTSPATSKQCDSVLPETDDTSSFHVEYSPDISSTEVAIAKVESTLPENLTNNQGEQSADDCPVIVTPPIKQIPVSLVLELLEIAYPEEFREDGEDSTPVLASCPIHQSSWSDIFDKFWEGHPRRELEAFNELAEQVNLCLWQIDNTFAIAQTYDVYSIGGRLAEYGLLVMDEDSTPPATAKQLASWLVSKERQYDSIQEIVRDALQDQRFDMLLALEVGRHPPVDRHAYWTHRYAGELAKTGVDYWQWRGNPESRQICPELTQLLEELPCPNPNASTVLERLADGEDPFQCFPLVNHAAERKESYRKAFTTWHEKALAQIGLDALERLYTVVYGCDWELIENIINPLLGGNWWEVLGVPRYASAAEVKAAHRGLAKEWHPDINPSPLARERMITINRALEEFNQEPHA